MNVTEKSWNWRWLWFISLYEFGFTEEKFWSLTPRQLSVFSEEYAAYKEDSESVSEDDNKVTTSAKAVYIDQIW